MVMGPSWSCVWWWSRWRGDGRGRGRRHAPRDRLQPIALPGRLRPKRSPATEPRAHHREPDARHHQARGHAQPRVQVLRQDVLGGGQGDEAQREDRGGVGRGHRDAQDQSVSRSAAGSDQVPRDHRLAVPRREGMQGPPAKRRAQQEHDQEPVGVAAREGVGEPVERPILAALAAGKARRSRDLPRSRPHLEARLSVVGRAREEVLGVASKAVGGIGGGDAGADVGPASREDLDRAPADPVGVGAVDQLHPAGAARQTGGEVGLDPGQEQPALARGKAEPCVSRGAPNSRRRPSARQLQAGGDLGQQRVQERRRARLPRSSRSRSRRSAGSAGSWGSRPGRGRSERGPGARRFAPEPVGWW